MPSIDAPATFAALTADGGATGVLTVASTAAFYPKAFGFISDDNTASRRIQITEILSATTMAARFVQEENLATSNSQVQGPSYGRSDFSAYTAGQNAKVWMPAQLVPVEPSFSKPARAF